jgi:hypothetical protein
MRVKCKSGLTGWRCRLRRNYSSFSEFDSVNEIYGLAARLGYKSAATAWRYNPMIEGSVNPSDFRRAPRTRKVT